MASTDWSLATADEREALACRALDTDAGRQLSRCFGTDGVPVTTLRTAALLELAADRPIDPNDAGVWLSRDHHASAVLRRHGQAHLSPSRLALTAVRKLISDHIER